MHREKQQWRGGREEQHYTHMQLKMGIRETFFFWRKNFNQPNILQQGAVPPLYSRANDQLFPAFYGLITVPCARSYPLLMSNWTQMPICVF